MPAMCLELGAGAPGTGNHSSLKKLVSGEIHAFVKEESK